MVTVSFVQCLLMLYGFEPSTEGTSPPPDQAAEEIAPKAPSSEASTADSTHASTENVSPAATEEASQATPAPTTTQQASAGADVADVLDSERHGAAGQSTGSVSPSGTAGLIPSTTDLVVGAVAVDESGAATSVTIAPLRLLKALPAWGLQVSGAYDTDEKIGGFAILYRFEPRWLAPKAYITEHEARDALDKLQFSAPFYAAKITASGDKIIETKPDASADSAMLAVNITAFKTTLEEAVRDHESWPKAHQEILSKQDLDAAIQHATAALLAWSPPDAPPAQPASAEMLTRLRDVQKDAIQLKQRSLRLAGTPVEDADILSRAAIRRRADRTAAGLTPAFTPGFSMDFFSTDLKSSDQKMIRSLGPMLQAQFRGLVFFELDSRFSATLGRSDFEDNTMTPGQETRQVWSLRTENSAVAVLPWAVRARPYDKYFLEEGLQRGLAAGVFFDSHNCLAGGDDRWACPKQKSWEHRVGGVLGLRLTKSIRPQLRLGHTWARKADSSEVASGFVVSAAISVAFSN